MPLHDSLNNLQLLLIELEYVVADVVHEINDLQQLPDDDVSPLRHNVRLVHIAADNLIISARTALSRDRTKKYLSLV